MTGVRGALVEALRDHVEVLCLRIGERTAFRGESLARAARYIRGVFQDAGLEVADQSYDYHGRQVTNLVAAPAGVSAASPYYLVGAHYDTVPGTPGADDNASAIAVLLELGRRITDSRLPVRLVAFTLEEPPACMTAHQGSRVFVRELARTGEHVLGAIILEMVGYTCPRQDYPFVLRWAGYPKEGNFIGIVGNWGSRRFARTLLEGFRKNERPPVESLLVPFNGWPLPETRLSDHASFWDAGLPAVMITDTAFFRNPNYHAPSDTPDTLDFGFMGELVTSLELALVELERSFRGAAIAGLDGSGARGFL